MDNQQDKKGNYERLDRLTDHDDGRPVEKPAINPVERGFDHENAEHLLNAAIRIKNFKFVPHGRIGLMGARGYDERSGTIGGLAQFDVTDIRQAKDSVDLQPKLARVQPPEPVAEASAIAAIDLGHPLIDGSDVATIVEIELRQGQEQRDH